MNRHSGFTLIELMIVIAIISIIAAIAVPQLYSSINSSREASAISSMRVVSTASEQYQLSQGSYPPDLGSLSTVAPELIDEQLASGSKSGYTFFLASVASTWTCTATPDSVTQSRHFFLDESGVIRQEFGQPAGPGSTPVN
ncbi:MAG TPA: prepilin-type N-terminal cleavage/methylation domain-containing protein [Planctomycetes bacterium]|nr:prepilin-type N-terminal cleavage/methylation domain-containing protein [Planctomycetota bacterium]